MLDTPARIPGFTRLDDITSLYEPPSRDAAPSTLQDKQRDPDLVVFCAWMSAAPKHIAKYTDGYRKLFPHTAILLVEARLPHMLRPTHPHPLTAATAVLRRYIAAKPPLAHRATASIALHASSNGGANTAAALVARLRSQGLAAPFDALTLDCSPGKPALHSACNAITLSLPRAARLPATVLIYIVLLLYMLAHLLLSRADHISRLRATLNSRADIGVGVPRLYLFSAADALVDAAHVREHAAEAQGKGCGAVATEAFARAPHCALLNEDAGRYWAAVERVVRGGGGEGRVWSKGIWVRGLPRG